MFVKNTLKNTVILLNQKIKFLFISIWISCPGSIISLLNLLIENTFFKKS